MSNVPRSDQPVWTIREATDSLIHAIHLRRLELEIAEKEGTGPSPVGGHRNCCCQVCWRRAASVSDSDIGAYCLVWKLEKGFFEFDPFRYLSDESCDKLLRDIKEREREVAGWTEGYFRRLFGIRTASSKHPAPAGPDKEDVRSRASVPGLLSALGISYTIRGDHATFRCPFHQDDRPSASFSLSKKKYFCHPCGEGGDIFGFVQRVQDCGFAEAVLFVHRVA